MGNTLKVNQLRAGAILSYISMFLSIFVAFVYTPIMLRLIGQAEYGLYSLIGSVVGYLSILDLGLGNAIVRYTARNRTLLNKDAESSLNGMFFILYCGIGVVTLIIGAILFLNIEVMFSATLTEEDLKKAKLMTALLVLNFAISFPLGVFGAILQAYERFVFMKLIMIIRSLISPFIILPLLYAGFGSVTMVVVQTILNLACLLANAIYCLKVLNIHFIFNRFDYPLFWEIARYSFFIFLNIIVDKIYWGTGQLILGVVSGTTLVAVYSIAMQLTTMYIMFSTTISGLLLPRISMMVANGASDGDLSQELVKIGRVQYVIMAYILSVVVLFGQEFIVLWAGEDYRDAYYIMLIVMIPLIIPLIQNVCIAILQAKNMNIFRTVVYFFIAVINVIVSIFFAKLWGGLGCALATSIALIIGPVIIMNVYYYMELGLDIPAFWKNISELSILVVISGTISYLVMLGSSYHGIIHLLMNMTIFSMIYFGIMWSFGLNNYEKELFSYPIKKY